MTKNPKRKVIRQSEFRIAARGIRRIRPDFSRLMQATLEHHTATSGPAQTNQRRSSTEERPK